jgi:glycosyltransferase involved in cell wall biosynthesis
MEKISIAILTKNEEKYIRMCLESVAWADEIVILDGFSTDGTVKICQEYTDKIHQRKFSGSFPKERQFLLSKVKNRWVFMVDADMVIPEKLKDEIMHRSSTEEINNYAAFNFRGLTIYLGKPIRHSSWFDPTYTRLFNKEKGKYDTNLKYIDNFVPEGKIGVMDNYILHYGFETLSEHLTRIDRYTSLNAEDLYTKGVRIKPGNILWFLWIRTIVIFFYKFIYKKGFLDGIHGFIVCSISAFCYLISYLKLWEIQKKK